MEAGVVEIQAIGDTLSFKTDDTGVVSMPRSEFIRLVLYSIGKDRNHDSYHALVAHSKILVNDSKPLKALGPQACM